MSTATVSGGNALSFARELISTTSRLSSYDIVWLVPRFGDTPLAELTGANAGSARCGVAADGMKASTRKKPHIVLRSVVRLAAVAGMLDAMHQLPLIESELRSRVPKPGRRPRVA